MSASAKVLRGSCLCGGIAFAISSPILGMTNCHCSMCRRQHGTAYATYAQIDRAGLTLSAGAELLDTYPSSTKASREFCRVCGSKLFYSALDAPQFVWVAAGVLDDDPGTRATEHIFTASKASWFDISDALPQYANSSSDA